MKKFIKLNTNEYPLSQYDIRKAHRKVSLPPDLSEEVLSSLGYAEVLPATSMPEYNKYLQRLIEVHPRLKDGKYYETWCAVDLTQEEIETIMEQTQKYLTNAVQSYMDAQAQSRNYDNIVSACTYATSTIEKFKAEGQACVAWRDNVWNICYRMLDEVKSGRRDIPTIEEVIKELPELIW